MVSCINIALSSNPNLCNLQSTVLRSHPKLNYGRVIIYRAKLTDILTSDDFHKLASFGAEDVLQAVEPKPQYSSTRGEEEEYPIRACGLYGKRGWGGGGASFKRGTFFRLQVHEDIGVRKSVISVCKKPKRAN